MQQAQYNDGDMVQVRRFAEATWEIPDKMTSTREGVMTYLRASLTIAAILATASVGSADIIYVPDDHDTIQEAINASSDGDSIIVRPETYVENINFIGKAITLKSEMGPDVTVIDGGNPPDPQRASVVTFRNSEGPGSVIDGFTLTNGTGTLCNCIPGVMAYCGGGIVCLDSSPTIVNNTVCGNFSECEGGGICCVTSFATITNNRITGNWAYGCGGGMATSIYGAPTVTSCTVTGNSADKGGGMSNAQSLPTVTNCTFSRNFSNLFGGGIYNCVGSAPTVSNCILWNDTPDEFYNTASSSAFVTCCCVQGGYTGTGNIDEDPLFCDPGNEDFTLCEDSPCAAENYPECGQIGAWGIGCGPWASVPVIEITSSGAFYLAPSSPNPFSLATEITYRIPGNVGPSPVLLDVLDPTGRLVRTLVDVHQQAGSHSVTWSGSDQSGRPLEGGVYFYRLSVGGETATKRMLLIR